MHIAARNFSFAGIPLLALAQNSNPRPAVLFYHGLHSDKETHRKELEDIARRGFLAVGVDAVGHGQRRMPDLSGFLARGALLDQVAKLLRPSLEEIPLLVDFLSAEGYGPFGLAGVSFGAMLAYGAIPREPRLQAVAAILGDPSWCHPEPEKYRETALLAWNGGRDQHVDARGSREFLGHLQQRFPEGSFQYQEYPDSDHFMEPQDWNHGWDRTLWWFEEHLTNR
jgi:uncharacterized protein